MEKTDWPWPNFTRKEMACRCGKCEISSSRHMDTDTLDKLQALRNFLGFGLPVTSGYRCSNHPEEAKKKEPGAHYYGQAVDVAVSHQQALAVVESARRFGFTGIGIKQKGNARFIHLDDMPNEPEAGRPRPHIYSY
ncbi:MAG: D-Ala-D-Ala carboxypeptidase family metallohydrolase [Shewanella sp.]